jgi:hypothetical protein
MQDSDAGSRLMIFELQSLKVRTAREHVEAELQSIGINRSEIADTEYQP